jgi:hypothetical protein
LGNQELAAITGGLGKAKGRRQFHCWGMGGQGTVLQDQMYLANLSSLGPKKSTKIWEAAREIFRRFFSLSHRMEKVNPAKQERIRRNAIKGVRFCLGEKINDDE